MGVWAAQQHGDERKSPPSVDLSAFPPAESEQARKYPYVLAGSDERPLANKLAEPGCGEEREAAGELVRNRQKIGFKLNGVSS